MRLQHPGGWFIDRVPAWIRWSTTEPGQMGAHYNGIYWNPPEPYRWCASPLPMHLHCMAYEPLVQVNVCSPGEQVGPSPYHIARH